MPVSKEISDLMKQRISKLDSIRGGGVDPYGERFDISNSIEDLKSNFIEGRPVKIAGRIMAAREHGKSAFYDVKGQTDKIQIYVKEDIIGKEQFVFLKNLDIGDIIGVGGELFKTRSKEPTIKAQNIKLLSKNLRPLPEKWHGLRDVETRYRQRYVDLIMNDKVKDVFITRTRIITEIRRFLDEKGYLEVETPMMQPIPGGATGRPFKTHHEALNLDLYLRIAPEIYLKKLLVGGFEKVYEINRNFRNEGISIRHNPEFTMLEVYKAYSDCSGVMKLTEELITHVTEKVMGRKEIEYQGKKLDLSKWEKVSFAKLVKENFDIEPDDDMKTWVEKLKKKGIEIEGTEIGRTQIINIIGELVEPKAHSHPVFVVDLFTELCPLAKTKRDNPRLTDRFELYMAGMEVANAYSELNDPIEQRKRFLEQTGTAPDLKGQNAKRPAPKIDEDIDEDFIRALEYGMPPAGGLGIGIDRLVMIFTDMPSIRDVILFPQLRPERESGMRKYEE